VIDLGRSARWVFALGFWLWAAFVAGVAGFLGSGLNCEGGNGCSEGDPSWLRPWTWGDHYVYPKAGVVGLVGLIPASAFVALVILCRRRSAAVSLCLSIVLSSYAFFAGLTAEGRALLGFGPLLGVVAVAITQRRARERLQPPARAR
jgi:hypothetical protein